VSLRDTSEGVGGQPLDALLAAYSSGAVSQPLGVLVESHLQLKPESRAFVEALDVLAGHALESTAPKPLANPDERLAAIFASDAAARRAEPAEEPDPVLPAPLRRYLGHGLDAVKWRWLMTGLREHKIGDGGASLLWAKSGCKMPTHSHHGMEVTLVLTGAFSDATGRFARGDIEIGDEDLDHRPIVEKGEDCFCFVVTDAPLRLTGKIGRWIEKLQSR
jgi:putative transcriptional regulator